MKGKYVIVRAEGAGVLFGILESKNGREVHLKNVRKLHYWEGAAAPEGLANDGTSKPDSCRFTVTVSEMIVDNCLQVIPCTEKAIESIKSVKEWKA